MHPTRTTTKLLLGVACAVSAVSGCVNVTPAPVQPATAPGAPGEPPRHEPRGGPGATPVVVQAPALEALKAVPGRPAGPAPSATGRRVAEHSAAPAAQAGTPDRGAGSGAPAGAPPVPDIPEPRRPGDPHRDHADGRPGGHRPRHTRSEEAEVPRELVRELPVRPADVCALGRRHGRWHPDSPEARICAGVHGG